MSEGVEGGGVVGDDQQGSVMGARLDRPAGRWQIEAGDKLPEDRRYGAEVAQVDISGGPAGGDECLGDA